jgi:ornithine carbamoyltransferase
MATKDFISVHDLTQEEFDHLFQLTSDVKMNPDKYRKALSGKTLAMIFQKSSTRTRVSFEVGIYQLGGLGLYLSASDLQLGRGETIADTARVLSRYVDGMMARTHAHQDILDLARYSTIPMINGLTNLLHPCQAMADYFTIMEWKKETRGKKIVYIGDGNNVCHSLLFGAPKVGMDITVISPSGFFPKPDILKMAEGDAKKAGTRIEVIEDIDAGVKDADVIYTDVWVSMGQEEQRAVKLAKLKPYQVNRELMKKANPDAIFMHCLPAHRGEEVVDEVIDSDQSAAWDEAENRLHIEKAIMLSLMGAGKY